MQFDLSTATVHQNKRHELMEMKILMQSFGQLDGQVIDFNDFLKALFLLITLSESWDTFRTTINNIFSANGLLSTTIESNLLT